MNKRFKGKIFKAALLTMCVAGVMVSTGVEALENVATLSGVQIGLDKKGSYNIVLKADKNVSVNKRITDKNKIVLELDGINPSETINTIYNNASDVDHVIFQPVSNTKMKVFIEGKNISSSKVSIDTDSFIPGVIQRAPKEIIELNKSVDNYKPVVNLVTEEEELVVQNENTVKQNAFTGFSLNTSSLGWIISLVMLILTMIMSFKAFIKPSRKKVNINLASDSLKNREMDLYKNLNRRQGLIAKSYGINKTSNVSVDNVSGSVQNYALKEYQNSQNNPKMKKSPITNSGLHSKTNRFNNQALLNAKQPPQTARKAKPSLKKASTITKQNINTTKTNVDSMRFLESMAQIYEKNGRVDLAHGLQNNIMKARIANTGI